MEEKYYETKYVGKCRKSRYVTLTAITLSSALSFLGCEEKRNEMGLAENPRQQVAEMPLEQRVREQLQIQEEKEKDEKSSRHGNSWIFFGGRGASPISPGSGYSADSNSNIKNGYSNSPSRSSPSSSSSYSGTSRGGFGRSATSSGG